MDPKSKTIMFLVSIVLISLYHFLPMVVRSKLLELRVHRLKLRFNQILVEGSESVEKLRMLKTLINNIKHCKDECVPLEGTLEEVRECYDNLAIANEKVFLRLSSMYNAAIFVPIFFPIIVQSVELLKRRK